MIGRNVQVHLEFQDMRHTAAAYLYYTVEGVGHRQLVFDIREEEVHLDSVYAEPSLRMAVGVAQQMMDQLWQLGMRPSQADSSANHVAALTGHLQDMRLLVFGNQQSLRLAEEELRKRVVQFPAPKVE